MKYDELQLTVTLFQSRLAKAEKKYCDENNHLKVNLKHSVASPLVLLEKYPLRFPTHEAAFA